MRNRWIPPNFYQWKHWTTWIIASITSSTILKKISNITLVLSKIRKEWNRRCSQKKLLIILRKQILTASWGTSIVSSTVRIPSSLLSSIRLEELMQHLAMKVTISRSLILIIVNSESAKQISIISVMGYRGLVKIKIILSPALDRTHHWKEAELRLFLALILEAMKNRVTSTRWTTTGRTRAKSSSIRSYRLPINQYMKFPSQTFQLSGQYNRSRPAKAKTFIH